MIATTIILIDLNMMFLYVVKWSWKVGGSLNLFRSWTGTNSTCSVKSIGASANGFLSGGQWYTIEYYSRVSMVGSWNSHLIQTFICFAAPGEDDGKELRCLSALLHHISLSTCIIHPPTCKVDHWNIMSRRVELINKDQHELKHNYEI